MQHKNFITLLILIVIFVLAWTGFNIYHNAVTSNISVTLSIQVAPINPTFNTKNLDAIKKRIKIAPVYDLEGVVTGTTSGQQAQNPTPTTAPQSNSVLR